MLSYRGEGCHPPLLSSGYSYIAEDNILLAPQCKRRYVAADATTAIVFPRVKFEVQAHAPRIDE